MSQENEADPRDERPAAPRPRVRLEPMLDALPDDVLNASWRERACLPLRPPPRWADWMERAMLSENPGMRHYAID